MSSSPRILSFPSTALDYFGRRPFRVSPRELSVARSRDTSSVTVANDRDLVAEPDPELKLPDKPSLFTVLVGAQLLQVSL
jgi:hypothetical protein